MPGTVKGRYRVLRRLGAGGMGEVFLAQDLDLERLVAVKVLAAELAHDPVKRKRFRHGAKAASALVHPNVCAIHEVGETDDGRPFLAMEYVEGKSLETLIRQGPLKPADALAIGLGVAEALAAAHARHLVHRDIKPGNIMLDRSGQVKVLDFGLAKRLSPHDPSASTSSVHTESGQLLGTPVYMSPEQLLGRSLDARSDLFSLGVVLYEALTGQRPFLGRTLGEVINNVVNQPAPPLGLNDAVFSAKADSVISKCLEKEPAQRYASARALTDDLVALRLESKPRPLGPQPDAVPGLVSSTAPKLSLVAQHRRSVRRFAAAFGLLAVLAVIGAALIAHQHQTGGPVANSVRLAPGQQSVAVLPFENFSAEHDTDYLSDGLTEEITTTLTRLSNLKVAARNSAFAFKGKKEDARRIADALRVRTLLEGSLRKEGNQLRVTAELINADDGFQLWSDTYNGTTNDLFRVQEDIARRIAFRLQGRTNLFLPATSIDPAAHDLYLRGREFWNKRTEPELRRAIDFFQAAVGKDPGYAQAHLGLAIGYYVLQLNSINVQPAELRPLARAEADRALELDPALAEAHAVLAWLQDYMGDRRGAEEKFRRALELDPNNATAHQWYGLYLLYHHRLKEAWPELQTATELDPFSPAIQTSLAGWHFYNGELDEAIRRARLVLERFPGFQPAAWILVSSHLCRRDYQSALAEIDAVRSQHPDDPVALIDLRAYALRRLGREAEARQILDQVLQLSAAGKRVNVQLAEIYAGLEEYDRALKVLQQLNATEGFQPGTFNNPLGRELLDQPPVRNWLQQAGLRD